MSGDVNHGLSPQALWAMSKAVETSSAIAGRTIDIIDAHGAVSDRIVPLLNIACQPDVEHAAKDLVKKELVLWLVIHPENSER